MTTTDLLKLAQTGQALALVGYNMNSLKKKKKTTKDMIKLGVGNIVGVNLIKATGEVI